MNSKTADGVVEADTAVGALSGLRVLDLSRVLAGPLAAQILADLGADVIKIERPGRGDDSREWAPPYMSNAPSQPLNESVYFWACNRGKRSIELDISTPEGREHVTQLAIQSDVLIENYKAGSLERYGLDHSTLCDANPRLIYCSITGFGHTGPYRDRPGYDTIIQGIGGLMSITGEPDDVEGSVPRKSGVAVADQMTALYAVVAILAALQHRARSGLGQWIDMALLDVQVSALTNLGMSYLATGNVPKRGGNRLTTVYPSDSFRCKDGEIMLIVGNDSQFRSFCTALGLAGVAEDPRFVHNAMRLRNVEALASILTPAIQLLSVAQCQALMDRAGVPAGAINNIEQVFADPQVVSRQMVRVTEGPQGQPARTIANPIRMSRTPPVQNRRPPKLGEHAAEILHDLETRAETQR